MLLSRVSAGLSLPSRRQRRTPGWRGCGDGAVELVSAAPGGSLCKRPVWWSLPGRVVLQVANVIQKKMPIPPEAAELANEANSVFVDEDYDTALELYTQVHRTHGCSRPCCIAHCRAVPRTEN